MSFCCKRGRTKSISKYLKVNYRTGDVLRSLFFYGVLYMHACLKSLSTRSNRELLLQRYYVFLELVITTKTVDFQYEFD
jgi:hypothetical protein